MGGSKFGVGGNSAFVRGICGAPVRVPQSLLKQGINPYEWILTFPDYLIVRYEKENDDIAENRRRSKYMPIRYQRSCLKINDNKSITVSKNGVVLPGSADFIARGYWAWASADEWLPTDYYPVMKSIK